MTASTPRANSETTGRVDVVPEPYLTIQELAARVKCSISTIRRLKKAGVIVAFQPGGERHRMFFPMDAVERVCATTASAEPSLPSPAPDVPAESPRPLRGPAAKWRAGI
jgi:excisionase family DNA binding protein